MATPKRITKEQAEANKKKQQVLKDAGYRIKVDGSWGPWQEKEYRKVISKENTNKANVGVMALPMAGYGAAQLFGGSIALPSLSSFASSLFPATIGALTLAGPAMGAYELYRGVYPKVQETPQERQERVYAPDATRTSRPIISEFPIEGNYLRPGIIGERYINPVLTRAASRSRQLATDTTATASGDTIGVGYRDTTTATRGGTTTAAPTNAPVPTNPNDNKQKRGFRDLLWEGSGDNGPSRYPNFWRYVRNYGIRLPLYTGLGAPVVDVVGNTIRASQEPSDYVHKWKWPVTSKRFALERGAWKLFGDAYAPDSVFVPLQSQDSANLTYQRGDTIVPIPRESYGPITTSTSEELDSINRAWWGE